MVAGYQNGMQAFLLATVSVAHCWEARFWPTCTFDEREGRESEYIKIILLLILLKMVGCARPPLRRGAFRAAHRMLAKFSRSFA